MRGGNCVRQRIWLGSAESEERLKTIKLVETLRTMQKAGLDLRKEMKRTFRPDQHKHMIKDWQGQVMALIEFEGDRYRNKLLMPPPSRSPMRHATESDLAVLDIEEWLHKLDDIIDDIDKPST